MNCDVDMEKETEISIIVKPIKLISNNKKSKLKWGGINLNK